MMALFFHVKLAVPKFPRDKFYKCNVSKKKSLEQEATKTMWMPLLDQRESFCPHLLSCSGETVAELRLPKDRLYAMCKLEAVQKYVRQSDYAFYQALVEVLIPDVLRPIPSESSTNS